MQKEPVPLVDLKSEYKFIQDEIKNAIQEVMANGDFILGKAVEEFESNFAKYIGTNFAVGVASGTDALYLSLKALNLEKDAEVITPSFTFIATVLAIVNAGLKPVLVDVSEKDYCIDVFQLEKKITKKTKVIIPVHLYGYPCNLDKVSELCRENKVYLIEDACQAHGTMYKNKKIGSFGIAGCFSFYPSKNLGGYGDGGMITTNDPKINENLRYLRNYGQTSKYEHTYFGINSRLDTLQASILNIKLKYLDQWNKKRREKASYYRQLLKDLPVILPPEDTPDTYKIYHVFVIRTKKRDELYKYLRENNVGTVIHYPAPIHFQKSFKELFGNERYPVSESLSREVLSLPLNPFISENKIEYICKLITDIFQ
ncbi:MAG: DegT/DnrJ/EryC1/StrS family aminotransferase [Planctomycetota bacterium]